MIKELGITMAILNLVAGCVAGVILFNMTGNYWYYIINVVTGGASGALLSFTLHLSDEVEA